MSLDYLLKPISNLDSPELLNFYRNGFHLIKRESYNWRSDFFSRVQTLKTNDSLYESKAKNSGAQTILNDVLESSDYSFVIDYLFETNLIQTCMKIVGMPLFLTNYTFIKCDQNTSSLPWHRDIYHYKSGPRVGLLPYSYKLIMTLDDLEQNSSGTELLRGSHNLDLNNYFFDLILKILKLNKIKFHGKQGDAMLFHGHCLHRRPRTPSKKSRYTIIFGLTSAGWHQSKYIENHLNVINRYNENLEKFLKSSEVYN